MKNTEHTKLRNQIRIELGQREDVVVWNNEQGFALTQAGTPVKYGVGKGGSDLIGVVKGGRFLGLEIKVGRDKSSPKQILFRELVNSMGGLCREIRSTSDAHKAVDDAIAGLAY